MRAAQNEEGCLVSECHAKECTFSNRCQYFVPCSQRSTVKLFPSLVLCSAETSQLEDHEVHAHSNQFSLTSASAAFESSVGRNPCACGRYCASASQISISRSTNRYTEERRSDVLIFKNRITHVSIECQRCGCLVYCLEPAGLPGDSGLASIERQSR